MTQIKRSAGQSAVAAAAYRAGEKLHSEYYGEDSDYTRKGGVICSEILLPPHAPPSFSDRETLWNEVEKAERGKKAQLAYSFDIALQNEFSMQENIELARQFLLGQFVSRGMVVDFAVHQPDKEDGGIPNPHFHVLCPIRPILESGKKLIYTSDGNYTQFIDDIAATGVNGFVLEPCTDMRYIAEKYGKTHAFIGNADTRILLSGTPEEIRAEVKRCMDIGKSCPGFFLAVGNHIPANTPVENCLIYEEAYREMCRRR